MMTPDDKEGSREEELVELGFLEGVARRAPLDTRVLKALGDLYTQLGQWQSGLDVDLKLSRLCPSESEVWYNLGCSYALLGESEQAFEALDHAVDLGYGDYEWMGEDEDLESIQSHPHFERLMYRILSKTPKVDPSPDDE